MEVKTIFTPEAIHQQTKRILSFRLFRNSPVLSRFLEFIVLETVEQKEIQIKEYSIAINVLHRTRDFNPNGDSIVRIHAGRLRRALCDYYLTQGIYDPIVISIPKGCYVPEFAESGTSKIASPVLSHLPELSIKIPIAIFPFRIGTQREGAGELIMGLKEQLSEDLLAFRNISVIGYYSSEMKARIKENILGAAKTLGAEYIVNGSLTGIGDRVRALVNLLVTETGEVLLCRSYDYDLGCGSSESLDAMIGNFKAFAADCYEVIFQGHAKAV